MGVRNLISISKSPWSSRVLFVPKKPAEKQQKDADKIIPGERQLVKPKLRMVIDFRYINSKLKVLNTHWVLPSIQDILGELHSAQYVTTIDICSGFWHFSLSKKCKKFTAFVFNDITYECNRLPQGLSIASKVMQYKMRCFILKYNLLGVTIYVDNIIIFAPDLETYKLRLLALFQACKTEGYKIKMSKSHHFITESFLLFGFQVDLINLEQIL